MIHKSGTNIGSNIAIDEYERLDRYRYAYRNEIYFFRREGVRGWSYCFCRLLLHNARVFLKSKDHRAKRLRIILVSTWKGFFFHPEIEYVQPHEAASKDKRPHSPSFWAGAGITVQSSFALPYFRSHSFHQDTEMPKAYANAKGLFHNTAK